MKMNNMLMGKIEQLLERQSIQNIAPQQFNPMISQQAQQIPYNYNAGNLNSLYHNIQPMQQVQNMQPIQNMQQIQNNMQPVQNNMQNIQSNMYAQNYPQNFQTTQFIQQPNYVIQPIMQQANLQQRSIQVPLNLIQNQNMQYATNNMIPQLGY